MKKLIITAILLSAALCQAQTVGLMPHEAIPQFEDNNGAPCAGCKIYSYAASTSTPLATYTDYTGLVSNTNPIILNSAGRPVDGTNIYLGSSLYKIVLTDSLGATIRTQDNVSNQGLITLTKAVLLAPTGNAEQDVSGIVGATSFHGTTAHTTSTGVRVGILDPLTVLDSAANPPNLITNSPAVAGYNYRLYDPLGHSNVVLSPDPTQAGGNTLDCSQITAGLTCKRYAIAWFPGGSCNNSTANLGWDTLAANAPIPACFSGTNIQKGVLGMPSAATKAQENTNSAAAAGTCTVTYPAATAAGDLLVGWTVVDGTRTVTGVTDGTNAYTATATVANNGLRLATYYFNGNSTAMAAGSTLTFTFSGAGNSVCGFLAYKDIKTAGMLDQISSNAAIGTAVTTGTTVGTAQNTELVLSFVGSPSNPTVSFPNGVTGHTTVSQSTNVTGSSSGLIQQATTTQTGSFTLGSSQAWMSVILTFKANVASSVTAQRTIMLPSTYVSSLPLSAPIKWHAQYPPTGTVNVKLGAQVVCTADGNTDDPVYNAASTSSAVVNASVANAVTQTLLTPLTATGCAASNLLHLQIQRVRYDPADTYEGYVYVSGAGLMLGVN